MSEKQILKSIDSRLRFIENSISFFIGSAFSWFVLYPIIEYVTNN